MFPTHTTRYTHASNQNETQVVLLAQRLHRMSGLNSDLLEQDFTFQLA